MKGGGGVKATIEGEFVQLVEGKSQDGRPFRYSTILSGPETVRVYDYDPGPGAKRLSPVSVVCEIRAGKEGKMYLRKA
jgi:hypothetical protein